MNLITREAEKRDYFRSVISEALKDLKKRKKAYVFSKEHIDVIKATKGFENVKVKEDEGIFYLTM